MKDLQIDATSPVVTTARLPFKRRLDWEQWMLVTSDRHLDNPKCKRKMLKRHLDLAVQRNAFVIDLGDSFCAMQGKGDKRSRKGDIREEDNKKAYYTDLVKSHVAFFEPYKDILLLQGYGNHETSVRNKVEIDLIDSFVERMRLMGSQVMLGGYRGWLRLMFKASNEVREIKIAYHHGSGGGGPVTKGIIGTNRRAVYLDADIVLTGHVHESWDIEIPRAYLTNSGQEKLNDVLHLCIPGYKEEYLDQPDGFHIERGAPPKPTGAWWVRFFYDGDLIRYEQTRAK